MPFTKTCDEQQKQRTKQRCYDDKKRQHALGILWRGYGLHLYWWVDTDTIGERERGGGVGGGG